jgi:hypothetical protein
MQDLVFPFKFKALSEDKSGKFTHLTALWKGPVAAMLCHRCDLVSECHGFRQKLEGGYCKACTHRPHA